MSAIAGAFSPILRGAGVALAGATGLLLQILFLFAIPLNVIAFMRLFGWEWWTALIAAVVIGFIPVLGWLCFFALIFVGAYFLVSANFDWKRATTPPMEIVSVSDMTSQEFAKFKTKLLPRFEAQCLREVKDLTVDGKMPAFAKDFCGCLSNASVAVITKDEFLYQQNTPALRARIQQAVAENCRTISH